MYYIGFEDGNHSQIGLARSRDGITGWEGHQANPLIRCGKDKWDHDAVYKPYAILDDRRWLLWYNGRGSLSVMARRRAGQLQSVRSRPTTVRRKLATGTESWSRRDAVPRRCDIASARDLRARHSSIGRPSAMASEPAAIAGDRLSPAPQVTRVGTRSRISRAIVSTADRSSQWRILRPVDDRESAIDQVTGHGHGRLLPGQVDDGDDAEARGARPGRGHRRHDRARAAASAPAARLFLVLLRLRRLGRRRAGDRSRPRRSTARGRRACSGPSRRGSSAGRRSWRPRSSCRRWGNGRGSSQVVPDEGALGASVLAGGGGGDVPLDEPEVSEDLASDGLAGEPDDLSASAPFL